MRTSICTLFEGDYHFGVAALVNSLARSGYEGDVWAGHRGPVPGWALDSSSYRPSERVLDVSSSLSLRFVELDAGTHLAFRKPTFMAQLLDDAGDDHFVAYLDPDIVLKCPWAVFAGFFAEPGVAVIEDVNHHMPARHPKRLQWAQAVADRGFSVSRQLDTYYNSGFVGVSRSHRQLLDSWAKLCDAVIEYIGDDSSHVRDYSELFSRTDQDALNLALMCSDVPITSAGPEAMDFAAGGNLLSHAAGHYKPWRGGHLRRAAQGHPPSPATKEYLSFIDGPINAVAPSHVARERRAARTASLVGRFYRRN